MKTIKPLSMRQQVNLLKDTGILRGEYLEGVEECLKSRNQLIRIALVCAGLNFAVGAVLWWFLVWQAAVIPSMATVWFLYESFRTKKKWNSRVKEWFKLQEDWDAIEEKYNPYLEELE